MATTIHRPRRRPRLNNKSVILLTISPILLAITHNTNNNRLPWPCLFASASSITHRVSSSYSQQQQQQLPTFMMQYNNNRKLDGNNYQADDQYINQGANNVQYDDDAANAAMAERDNYDKEMGDDGYLNMDFVDMNEVSIMPVSCVNYHNGHMIKFQFFEKSSSLNCHFKNLGTFVVSIAHYMRAYFNYQALTHGNDFSLPGDVGFLNCVMLKETANSDVKLYAKIGCQHRNTYTSTKLQLIVYTDQQCSQVYGGDDGEVNKDGYDLDGYFLSNKVSFRPAFYNCQSCLPDQISDTFSKQNAWYDDDYISEYGYKQGFNQQNGGNDNGDDAAGDDAAKDDVYAVDDANYYAKGDDTVYYDDANNGDDGDDGNNKYVNTDDQVKYNYAAHDDDFYNFNDDGNRRRLRKLDTLDASHSLTAVESRKDYEADFQQELALIQRHLEDAAAADDQVAEDSYDNTASWNMCQQVQKYGMYCDADCQALDTFRVDEWSRSDVCLLAIMIVFMGAMMLLVFAKRVKAYERAAMWGDEPGAPNPGLPPGAMLMLFAIVFTIIVVLAALKFVNETLVFAVVACVLLFIYMLKLTLFESRKQVFLPARRSRNTSLNEPFYYT